MGENEKKLFIGKKINDIKVDGYSVYLLLEDGTKLYYSATDGGFSDWEIESKDKKRKKYTPWLNNEELKEKQ